MESIVQYAKWAAIGWGTALVLVAISSIGPLQRLFPDWLRNLSRLVVLVGTIAALTAGVLVGSRLVISSLEAAPEVSGRGPLSLSFESPGAFFTSLYLSAHQAELEQPAGDSSEPVTFVVSPGETAAEVAAHLEERGLVVNGEVFRRYMALRKLDASLQAGTFSLRRNMTIPEVAEALQYGVSNAVTVTILEGWRAEQTAWLLEQRDLVRSDDFLAEVKTGRYDYLWLSSRPQGASLEGYLFPDTYQFPAEVTPAEIVDRMLATFDARVAGDIQALLTGRRIYDIRIGGYRPLTVHDVVTLASIVEREAVVPEERPIIASVYFNRLDPAHVNETALRLSADPTVQYAKGYDPATGNWWSPMLPGEGQTIDSPYNTFRVQGLPPGPICSPGLAAIQAVLSPAQTDYLYFHAIGDGSHVFAATLEEHLRNQQRYKP